MNDLKVERCFVNKNVEIPFVVGIHSWINKKSSFVTLKFMYTVSLNYYNLFVIQNIAVLASNPSFKLNLSMIMPPNFLFHDCDVQQGGPIMT